MKQLLLVALALSMGCSSQALSPSRSSEPKEVLVTFNMPSSSPTPHAGSQRSYRNGTKWDVDLRTRQRGREFARRHNVTLKEGWPIEALDLYCVAYVLPASVSIADLQAAAAQSSYIHSVQPNTRFRGMGQSATHTYDDPLFKYQYGHDANRLLAFHQHSKGHKVAVGIVDSSVDENHPDLRGQIKDQEAFTRARTVSDLKHGTAVAGIIAAAEDNSQGVVGLAPEADLHVFGACRSIEGATACDSFSVLKAIQAALDERVEILNLSLAGPTDPLVEALIDQAHARNVIVIAATNTERPEENFPANHWAVLAASDDLGLWFTHPHQMTTQAGGGYQVFSGTSVSAAGLSGVATLLRARYSEAQTRAYLKEMLSGCTERRTQVFGHDACL